MALPNSNLEIGMVRGALGAATNNVGQLCIHPNVNKWSKRKPFVDTRVAPTEPRYWRRSNISDYIRCGLMLPSDPNQVDLS